MRAGQDFQPYFIIIMMLMAIIGSMLYYHYINHYPYLYWSIKMLTPAGLEVQIFVDPKDAKNVPAEIKEQIREEVQSKGNML